MFSFQLQVSVNVLLWVMLYSYVACVAMFLHFHSFSAITGACGHDSFTSLVFVSVHMWPWHLTMTLTLTQKGIGRNIQHMKRVYIERNRYLVALKDHEPDQWYQAIVKKHWIYVWEINALTLTQIALVYWVFYHYYYIISTQHCVDCIEDFGQYKYEESEFTELFNFDKCIYTCTFFHNKK